MIKVLKMGSKLNVVDSDNNLVGFDLENHCCSDGGYFISEERYSDGFSERRGVEQTDFPYHVFDPEFFEEIHTGDDENAVIFRFKATWAFGRPEERPLYLHLYNVHNGYYSKGFKASFREIKTGYL